ncbi:MAG: hypothetical protein OZSIB_1690 [Candidatus Ozemobacter sibiricus]|uniref:Uncharacterized protein n=1 Tax=Candidatus Ozemobacter sibiricus TaxID=2268124 RepID=A0A367ZJ62_9BACT|nr:MAG: hypothetical protein OZSIB_1690 [Candidatus Ozemobacter sibiricus]
MSGVGMNEQAGGGEPPRWYTDNREPGGGLPIPMDTKEVEC